MICQKATLNLSLTSTIIIFKSFYDQRLNLLLYKQIKRIFAKIQKANTYPLDYITTFLLLF